MLIGVGSSFVATVLEVSEVPKVGDTITIKEGQIIARAAGDLFLQPGMTLTLTSCDEVDFEGRKIPRFYFKCKLA